MSGQNLPVYLLSAIEDASQSYILNAYKSVWTILEPVYISSMVLFVTLFGISMITGSIQLPVKEFITWIVKATILYWLISTWTFYLFIIVETVTDTPDHVIGVLNGSPGVGSVEGLGAVYNVMMNFVTRSFEGSGWVMPYISGVILWLISHALILYAVFLVGLAKLAAAILLGLGPIFVALMLFKKTEKITEAWIQYLTQTILVIIFTSAILGFMTTVMQQTVKLVSDGTITLGNIAPVVTAVGVTIVMLMQVSSIAASLAGGIAISTQRAGRYTVSAARGYAGSAMRTSGRAGRAAVRRVRR